MSIEEDYPLSLEEFKVWLKSKDPDIVIGLSNCFESCPVSNALKESKYKFTEVLVEEDETLLKLNDWMTLGNPNWVYEFVSEVDEIAEGQEVNVTAKQALEILSSLEKK